MDLTKLEKLQFQISRQSSGHQHSLVLVTEIKREINETEEKPQKRAQTCTAN